MVPFFYANTGARPESSTQCWGSQTAQLYYVQFELNLETQSWMDLLVIEKKFKNKQLIVWQIHIKFLSLYCNQNLKLWDTQQILKEF